MPHISGRAVSLPRMFAALAIVFAFHAPVHSACAQTAPAEPQVSPSAAQPQGNQVAPAPQVQPQAPAPQPQGKTGLIEEVGKMFKSQDWSWPATPKLPDLPKLPTPAETLEKWGKGAKSATDGLGGLSASSVVTGRTVCPPSSSGGPDCDAAATALCQSKGFKQGKVVDYDAAKVCSPQKLLMGHKLNPEDCKSENFVTRAVCQ